MRLGIDFGTTRTVVAAAEQGRYPVAAFETDAGYSEYLPGIAVLRAGQLHFGFDANQALSGAEGSAPTATIAPTLAAFDAAIDSIEETPNR